MDPKESVTTLNISLPTALKNYIERQVQEQAYTSASEFIRMLIRNHQELQGRLNRLEDLLVEGLDSGPGIEATPEYWAKKRAALLARHSGEDPGRT